jgi:ATP/ADP translocase
MMEWLRAWANQVFLGDLPLPRRFSFLCFSLALFVALASQQFIGPVKTALFFDVVGASHEPWAKTMVFAVLVPVLFLYSLVASVFTSRWLVLFVCTCYVAVYLVIALALIASHGHQSPAWLPWLLYYATETKGVIIMPMIWSVVVDTTPPELCRQAFPPIFFVIQLGGVIGSLIAVSVSSLGGEVGLILLQIGLLVLVVAFAFLACGLTTPTPEEEPIVTEPSMNVEAADSQADDNAGRGKKEHAGSPLRAGIKTLYNGIEGLVLLLSRPYVFMTFWVSYATLMPRTVLDYENQVLVNNAFSDREDKISFLGKINVTTNSCTAILALVGTSFIVERCGMRLSLMALPLVMMMCVIGLCLNYGMRSSVAAVVVASVIAYGLNSPCKEMLYVRTSRDIKYKAKSWSEMYGNQVMKLLGAQLNFWVNRRSSACGDSCFHPLITIGVVAVWVCLWLGIAMRLGGDHARLEKEKKYVM